MAETVGLGERLLYPEIGGQRASWPDALALVAKQLQDTILAHGPDSVAFYVSGQMLSEDYYLANKLMKGFIGSANIDTNSRLCMASTVAGHRRAFGTDTVPGLYEDLETADVVVLVGSNLAWCHPILYQRIRATMAERPDKRLVIIDPRRSASVESADLHLAIAPGSDVALFNGLLAELAARDALDHDYLTQHVEGFAAALAAAEADDISVTGLSAAALAEFYDLWIGHSKVVTVFSQGVNQSSSGTDKVNAIINCHLASGRIGKPGAGPFSVTGQPNAMGGREVGGLANTLACHLDIDNPLHRNRVQEFWQSPAMPTANGLKAVDMFEAVAAGRIKALWIIHSNPAVTLPDADNVREAIRNCQFTVVSDITARTDTARLASVLLPAAAWGEKSGTVTNSDRTISRQRAVMVSPGEVRPDWAILAEVGRLMGWEANFSYQHPAEIFREYASLSGIAGEFDRDFDISGLAELSTQQYEALQPFRWPLTATRSGGRFFANGGFYHANKKARMIALTHRPPLSSCDPSYPFRLNSGRIRDQWHTMTRTALSPRLSAHFAEPFVDIHPHDAATAGIGAADLVALNSVSGKALLRARITDEVQPGNLFVPMHWTGENAPSARIDALVAARVDPISGQPESKASVVSLARYAASWYGFAVSRLHFRPTSAYWARARTKVGFRAELAGDEVVDDWLSYALDLFTQSEMPSPAGDFRDLHINDLDAQVFADAKRGLHRISLFRGDALFAALYVAPSPVQVTRDYLAELPGTQAWLALAGHPPGNRPDPGPVICSCFSIGRNTILQAIKDQGLTSVAAVGGSLSAGTNCGSCKSEIAALLAAVAHETTIS